MEFKGKGLREGRGNGGHGGWGHCSVAGGPPTLRKHCGDPHPQSLGEGERPAGRR